MADWQAELQSLVAEWEGEGGPPALPPAEAALRGGSGPREPDLRSRLQGARLVEGLRSGVEWSRLLAAGPMAALEEEERLGERVEVNSGGEVFFGLLAPRGGKGAEEGVAFKFCNARHRRQSEQMAAEFAWHLGVGAPESRLLLRAHDEEWRELSAAAEPLCGRLGHLLGTKQSLLVMQFLPGEDLSSEREAWRPEHLAASCASIGRLLVLDMLLGNCDRLPVRSLAWRGNPGNVLWTSARAAGERLAPIDALVARRPPRLLVQEEDRKVGSALELMLLDAESAHRLLSEAVSCSAAATAALRGNLEGWAACREGEGAAPPVDAVKAFHEGVQGALAQALQEQGLLEMAAATIFGWFQEFHADLGTVAKGNWRSRTAELKDLSKRAERSDEVRAKWEAWQELMRRRSLELHQASLDWAKSRGLEVPMSVKGFIGATVLNPIMDAYELMVRLQHLTARLRVMSSASSVTRPWDLAPLPLLVGPATSAGCFHLLRKLGVQLILNCTPDLPEPSEQELQPGLRWRRLALEDREEQDLSQAFEEGLQLVDEAVEAGGRVLVHCHEGRSRSVSLCLAYMVARRRQPLAEALAFVKERNSRARPNAGFWKQLMQLERRELGCCSVAAEAAPKGKPKGIVCELCGEVVGLSERALVAHKTRKHKVAAAAGC